ncbi:MAG: peptidase [Actinobacteria bacterium]|nr:peptidase [Actinomycetota bacterium]
MTSASAQEGRPSAVSTLALVLSISRASQTNPGSIDKQVTLTCDPDGGTHPHPRKACDAPQKVRGDIAALPGDPHRFCPAYFSPVTATANGIALGRLVTFRDTYSNICYLHAALTPVFDF